VSGHDDELGGVAVFDVVDEVDAAAVRQLQVRHDDVGRHQQHLSTRLAQ
jgi:hypothetical protein